VRRPIKIGNLVTWTSRRKTSVLTPMSITGCKVLQIGTTNDGYAAAKLDCGRLFGIRVAYMDDLELENEKQTILSAG
jgi:hypothetical protein